MWSFFSKDPAKDFNFDIGEPIPGLEDKSIWKLHKARRKSSGELFSVFVLDCRNGVGSEAQMELAKASVKRLKTVRHPNILTYVDSLQGDKVIYLVTEYVEPLETRITSSSFSNRKGLLSSAWGIYQLARALSFLNNDCGFTHHSVCLSSVFVNQAGEWKLGGVEYVTNASSESQPIKIIPLLDKYDPPEKNDSVRLKSAKTWSADMWGLGCLIWEVFNGNMSKPAQMKTPGKVPKDLVPLYCELIGANPASRPSPSDFLSRCRADRGYLKNNFIDTLLFLEEIQIKDATERTRFFNSLPQNVDDFPEEICRYKILPQLLSAFEYGGAGPAILTPLFKLGKLLPDDEYQKNIIPCVVKLFSSSDRATRAKLLQQVEQFVDHLQANVINTQVFPELVNGFMDTNATIREVTVKSILHLAPKLNYNNLNVELLKHFARLQAKDPEGGIRTNTTVCLGKIAHHLHPDTRKKVLATAFVRAMRDPFSPARTAGILALAATQKFYSLEDSSRRVLPALCQMTIDPDKSVREQAFKAIKGFLGKLEKVSEDPSLAEQFEADVNAASSVTTADTARGWAGWAVTSLTSKLYKSSASSTAPTSEVPTSGSKAPAISKDISDVDRRLDASPPTQAEDGDLFTLNEKCDSDSDYEKGNDENVGWGDMDSSALKAATKTSDATDGWDTGWDDADFTTVAVEKTELKPASNYNWGKESDTSSFTSLKNFNPNVQSTANTTKSTDRDGVVMWDSPENTWEPITEPGSVKKEGREQRQRHRREVAEKRIAGKNSGPMKLGERRMLP